MAVTDSLQCHTSEEGSTYSASVYDGYNDSFDLGSHEGGQDVSMSTDVDVSAFSHDVSISLDISVDSDTRYLHPRERSNSISEADTSLDLSFESNNSTNTSASASVGNSNTGESKANQRNNKRSRSSSSSSSVRLCHNRWGFSISVSVSARIGIRIRLYRLFRGWRGGEKDSSGPSSGPGAHTGKGRDGGQSRQGTGQEWDPIEVIAQIIIEQVIIFIFRAFWVFRSRGGGHVCVAAKSLPITLQPHPLYLCLSALPALVPRPSCIQMQCLARDTHAPRARPLACSWKVR